MATVQAEPEPVYLGHVHAHAQRFATVSGLNYMFPGNQCATGFGIHFLLFGECVKNVSLISSNMYINHAVLKRQLEQWVQVKSFTNVSAAARYMQQLKILEEMFVMRVV